MLAGGIIDGPEGMQGSKCATEEKRVCGRGERCWIIAAAAAAAKDVHNVLVAIYSEA